MQKTSKIFRLFCYFRIEIHNSGVNDIVPKRKREIQALSVKRCVDQFISIASTVARGRGIAFADRGSIRPSLALVDDP